MPSCGPVSVRLHRPAVASQVTLKLLPWQSAKTRLRPVLLRLLPFPLRRLREKMEGRFGRGQTLAISEIGKRVAVVTAR